MSYVSAPTFEGNFLGVRRLRTLGNAGHMLGGLGDFTTDSYAQAAIAAGFNSDDINTLIAGGATTQDLSNLINGNTTVPLLLNKLYPPDVAAASSGGVNPAVPPPSPSPAGPAQSPTGSTLVYVASWTAGFGNLFTSPNAVIAKLVSGLAAQNMSASGSATASGPMSYGIQLTIRDNVGHATLADIQSILHPLMIGMVGTNLSAENLSLVAYPGQTPPTTNLPGSPQNLTQWFESNAGYVGAGVAALVLVGIFFGGGRR